MSKKKPDGQSKRARKQANRKKRQQKRKKPSEEESDVLPLSPFFATEQMMGQMFGFGGDDDAFNAQQLAYEAMDAAGNGDIERGIELAEQALELDPNCVDALTLMAQIGSGGSLDKLIDNMEQVIERAEQALGPKFFRENRGYFWGILETRPYMRARDFLAARLLEAGRIDEAILHYEDMLDLNPNDNQGVRYTLLGLFLETDRVAAATSLFEQFEDEGSAMFAWARVLERWLNDDLEGARQALAEAREVNPYVEPLLTGRKRMPRRLPEYYGFGDENEAIVCMDSIGAAWKKHKAAVNWLKEQAG